MAEWRSYGSLFLGLSLVFQANGIFMSKLSAYYLQNMCYDGVERNTTLTVQSGSRVEYWANPNDYSNFIDCRITLTPTKDWLGLVWRGLILLPDEQTMPNCDIGFVEFSSPNTKLYKFCGRSRDIPTFLQYTEFPRNIDVTLRLYVNFSAIANTSIANNASALRIVLDATSFTYCSSPGPQSLVCLQSRRCLDESQHCDGLLNCASPAFPNDRTDETQCQGPAPRNILLELIPLWAILGALVCFLLLYWCCFKPGYIPWRLARIRNARCYGCPRSSSVGNQRGCFNCCSRSHGRSVSPVVKTANPESSSQFPTGYNDKTRVLNDDNNFNYQAGTLNWMSIKFEDGNHQRELR